MLQSMCLYAHRMFFPWTGTRPWTLPQSHGTLETLSPLTCIQVCLGLHSAHADASKEIVRIPELRVCALSLLRFLLLLLLLVALAPERLHGLERQGWVGNDSMLSELGWVFKSDVLRSNPR